jgi:hypothetical protein
MSGPAGVIAVQAEMKPRQQRQLKQKSAGLYCDQIVSDAGNFEHHPFSEGQSG